MSLKSYAYGIKKRSEVYAKILSSCSTLLKYSDLALETKNYLKSRVPDYNNSDFTFGYFPPSEHLNVLEQNIPINILKKNKLIYERNIFDNDISFVRNFSYFEYHSLIIPYKDLYGNIIGFVGRSVNNDLPPNIQKYKNTNFYKSLQLFGLYNAKHAILDKDCVFVVEGQFDCISLRSAGILNVVALCGSELGKIQLSLLKRYTNNINLLLDNDEAGVNAANKVIKKYNKYVNIKKINLPLRYKDIDTLILSGQSISDVVYNN